jgi:alkylated DNA repair dioxygenase AlkB
MDDLDKPSTTPSRKRSASTALDEADAPASKRWSPLGLAKKLKGYDHSRSNLPLMKPMPFPEEYGKVRIHAQTLQSVVWSVQRFDVKHKVKDFMDLDYAERPPLVSYDRECHSRRDMYYSNLEEWKGNDWISHYQPGEAHSLQCLKEVLAQCDEAFPGYCFDGILANRYLDGNDYIAAHRDKEVYPGDIVVALAYGATRTLRIRDYTTNKIIADIMHLPGMLIVMQGACQIEFLHEVPVQRKVLGTRVSLTLRRFPPQEIRRDKKYLSNIFETL